MKSRLLALVLLVGIVSAFTTEVRVQTGGAPIAGIYRLVTIDGHAIPFAPVHPGRPANVPGPEVLASTMVLRDDGSFISAMAYRMSSGGNAQYNAQPFSGTYAADGDAWVARWDGAGTTRLTVARDTLVMDNEGMLFAYRKIR